MIYQRVVINKSQLEIRLNIVQLFNVYNVCGCAFNLEWGSDDLSLYYTRADDNNRPYTVLRHKTCQSILSDDVLYEEEDERCVKREITLYFNLLENQV